MHILLSLILVSFNALALDWTELEEGSTYRINQNFQLTQLERSSSKLDISSGETVYLNEMMGLPQIRVMLYSFTYQNCPGPKMETDMDIIPVQGTSPVVEIGAQLEENCVLKIYIENRDLMSKSLFE